MQRLATLGNRTHGFAMEWFQAAKIDVVELTGLTKDALHVHIGVIAFLALCLLLRRRAWDWPPLLAVLLLTLAGELVDMLTRIARGNPMVLFDHVHDLVNTMVLPTLIFIVVRYTNLFSRPSRHEAQPVAPAAGSDADIGETGDLA